MGGGGVLEISMEGGLGPPSFSTAMSRGRHAMIAQRLHFDDKEWREHRKRFAPIKELWNMWGLQLQRAFQRRVHMKADEQLVPFRGWAKFIVFMLTKPAK